MTADRREIGAPPRWQGECADPKCPCHAAAPVAGTEPQPNALFNLANGLTADGRAPAAVPASFSALVDAMLGAAHVCAEVLSDPRFRDSEKMTAPVREKFAAARARVEEHVERLTKERDDANEYAERCERLGQQAADNARDRAVAAERECDESRAERDRLAAALECIRVREDEEGWCEAHWKCEDRACGTCATCLARAALAPRPAGNDAGPEGDHTNGGKDGE